MFENFTDEQFYAWFAGFFDGEGCIYLPKKGSGVEFSVANTDKDVILAIQERWQLGTVTEITFSEDRWHKKYHWRVRTYDGVETILDHVYQYLTIKRNCANDALERIYRQRKKKSDRQMRDNQIIALAQNGWRYQEIADKFGVSYRNVARICQSIISSGRGGHAKPEIRDARKLRRSVEHYKKPSLHPKTTTRIIIPDIV